MSQVASSASHARAARIGIAVASVLLLTLAAIVVTLRVVLGSTQGLALALRVTAAVLPVNIQAQGPSGRLNDQFGWQQLQIEFGHTHILIKDLQARIDGVELRGLRIRLARLNAAQVQVRVDPGPASDSEPPRQIGLPLQLDVANLQVDAFEYWGPARPQAPPLRVSSIRAALAASPRQFQVTAGRFTTSDLSAQLDATLATGWPFAVAASGKVQSTLATQPVQAEFSADGSLHDLHTVARLVGSQVGGSVQVDLHCFAVPSLIRVTADLRGIDPASWRAGAPHADLDVRIDVRPAPGREWTLGGTVDVLNRVGGTIDTRQLPAGRLHGSVVGELAGGAGTAIRLNDFVAQLDHGRVSGRFELTMHDSIERWSLDAALSQVDLSKLHSRLQPLLVDGTLHTDNHLEAAGSAISAQVHLYAKAPVSAELTLDLKSSVDQVRLNSSRLLLGAGELDSQGLWDRSANRLALHGTSRALDAGLLFRALRTRVDGSFEVDATLGPGAHGVGRFELLASQICVAQQRCLPAQGQGSLELLPSGQLRADLQLTLRTARLRAHGVLDDSDGRLQLDLQAPQLADLDPGLQGALQVQAMASGRWQHPDIQINAQARELGASGQPAWLQDARASLQGSVSDHAISLQATLAGGRPLVLRAQGTLADRRWTGVVAQAELGGSQKVQLSGPAPLVVDATHIGFGPAQLRVVGATVQLTRLELSAQQLVTQGRFEGLRLPQAVSMVPIPVDSAADPLLLRGRWDLTLGQHADGELLIERASGDLRPSTEVALDLPLGLRELSASFKLDHGQLRAQASMDSARGGSLTATLLAALERSPGGFWRLARQQPWHLEANARLPAIEALSPLFSQRVRANVRLAGRLAAAMQIAGTPEDPNATGTIEGDGLRVAWVDQGVRLEGGRLRARVEGEQIQIDELRFEGPLRVPPADRRASEALRGQEAGFVAGSGRLRLSDLTGSLQVQAQRLPLLQQPDRWLVASGGGNVEFSAHRVQLNGAVVAEAGFLDLGRPDLPSLSDDVRVSTSADHVATPSEPQIAIGFDLGIDLGPAFYLRGSGLDARITGPLRLRGEGRGPVRTTGAITVEQGTYEGFGQRLSIKYGRINFQGAADNPNLDVLAVRTDLPVEVGASVTGSVARPIVRLYSDPALPDYETLSWLALGRPPGDARTDNIALAQLAAGLLSGSGEGIQTRLARSLGIDQVNVRSGEAASTSTLLPRQSVAGKLRGDDTAAATSTAASQIISIGHRVNDVITVSYEQAVSGASNVVQVSYQLSKRLSLIGRTGSENALDLVFSLSFD